MESIRELFRIGNGPSSSHTIGPLNAATQFRQRYPDAAQYRVSLYGSLAATGKGHLTNKAITEALLPSPVELVWIPEKELPLHPNGMCFEALDNQNNILGDWRVYSVGGGALREEGSPISAHPIYDIHTMSEILSHSAQRGTSLWEYVESVEGPEIWMFLAEVWHAMSASIDRGINAEGALPGGLGLARKACAFYRKTYLSSNNFLERGYLTSYALAVAEENASGGVIVTAPTCGSSGVLPAVLRHIREGINCQIDSILRALATAGLIGNFIKYNASISGAEVGCQGEIGAACSMAAAAATQLLGGTVRQIEYAAEMGLEHHLGLTCDPVGGLVQIPCIERTVFAASRAVSCANYALFSDGSHLISFDEVVEVMKQTGHDLPSLYRETSHGGLAKAYHSPTGNS